MASKEHPGGSSKDRSTKNEALATEPGAVADQRSVGATRPSQAAETRGENEMEPEIPHDVPPPAYSEKMDELVYEREGLGTRASLGSDGRINININQKSNKLSHLLAPALRSQLEIQFKGAKEPSKPYVIPALLGTPGTRKPPSLCVVIQIVGSRGDVQPFIALGLVIKKNYGHRVRIATHPVFKSFVEENGLEFFSIGGDPAELMAFMVKHPGLMPGMEAIKNGDISKRRKQIYEMIKGCWRSCIEAGDGMDIETNTDDLESLTSAPTDTDPLSKPFIADAIIANPPSFAHIHVAEKLGIPIHMMFTMPWSPTQAFPHPLANIESSNAAPDLTNFISYVLVEMLTTQGLGDLINRFREYKLGLEPISLLTSPGILQRLKIPYTYCWSPALIPKPKDWGQNIDIPGFYFLSLATNYQPDPELAAFLAAGPPPVYIGFGSIVVDDPTAMTQMIFKAVKLSGTRALVSKGWGGLGADKLGKPDDVFMLGNVPHDWLFNRVAAVVHHGGAGTTAAGIAAGKPTVIVPFFGDQAFWGSMIAKAGAGPEPVPYSKLSAEKLALMITTALEPASVEKAKLMAVKIQQEKGTEKGAESFQSKLQVDELRCMALPTKAAAWHIKSTKLRLSACAAAVLGQEGLIDYANLRLYRAREYDVAEGPWEPLTGAASALMGTVTGVMMGVGDFPRELFKAGKKQVDEYQRPDSRDKDGRDKDTMSEEVKRLEPAPGSGTAGASATLSPTSAARSRGTTSPTGRSRSPSNASVTPPLQEEPEPVSLEALMGAGKGVGRIVGTGLKSPMDFTMALAKGFHNAPKLYGDDTVRPAEKITGVSSGLRAAGKTFGLGWYDGITGVFTQPLRGAQKEGAAGLFKGLARGAGGLILKPGAAIWGLPGYAMTGLYKEIQKRFGSSVQNYLIAARTAQGHYEAQQLSDQERKEIIARWKGITPKGGPGSKSSPRPSGSASPAASSVPPSGSAAAASAIIAGSAADEEKTEEERLALEDNSLVLDKEKYSFRRKFGLSFDERKKLAEEEKIDRARIARARAERGAGAATSTSAPSSTPGFSTPNSTSATATTDSPVPALSVTEHHGADSGEDPFEAAIRESVRQTSKGNPAEDELIAKALRQSVNALRDAQSRGLSEEEALGQAVAATTLPAQASLPVRESSTAGEAQASAGVATMRGGRGTEPRAEGQQHEEDAHEKELERAREESLKQHAKGLEEEEAARREEEVVMEYVKKQSLREEELRRGRDGGQ